MKSEEKDWIKRCVLEHHVRLNEGKVRLSYVQSLFSQYGDRQELKQVLDEFVRDGEATANHEAGDTIYVFEAWARIWGEQLIEKREALRRYAEREKAEIQAMSRQDEKLEEMSSSWRSGWERLVKDPAERAIVENYISSFWREQQQKLLPRLLKEASQLKEIENEIDALNRKIDRSYRPTRAA